MAGSVNRMTLVGNLGRAPELRVSPKGTPVARFSLATNERWVDDTGERQERTQWHQIVVWGKTAEACKQYLEKGQQCYVEGAIRSRSYTDSAGQAHGVFEIVAERVLFLGGGHRDDTTASTLPEEHEPAF